MSTNAKQPMTDQPNQARQQRFREHCARTETCDRYGHVIERSKPKMSQELKDLNRVYAKIRSGLN